MTTVAALANVAEWGRLPWAPPGDGGAPLIVIDLDGTDWRDASTTVLGSALQRPDAPVVVGIATTALPDEANSFLESLTTTLHSGAGSITAAGTPDDLPAITDAVTRAPTAALFVPSLLRLTSRLDVPESVVAESMAYSTLLAGEEFRAWRERTPARPVPTPTAPAVLAEREGDVLTLALNRPERRNAYGRAVRDALLEGLAVAEADPSVEAVVLRGTGQTFSSGGDLDEFGQAGPPPESHLLRIRTSAGLVIHRLCRRGTPVRAEVHGACIGAGIEIPAFTDHVTATPDAWFKLPELSMGLVPGAGGTVSVTRRIGRWRTAWMVLTGAPVDARTALAWGLVDAVA